MFFTLVKTVPSRSQHLLNRGQTLCMLHFTGAENPEVNGHNTFLIEVKLPVGNFTIGQGDRSQHLLNRGQTRPPNKGESPGVPSQHLLNRGQTFSVSLHRFLPVPTVTTPS